ncbi:efflux RND transporter permease subunit [Paraclostridium sordellii]|uniref:efflux RND transporter permease subunit n=1 Tax=Paraclostridium sordellii TaxID=1505 RepID=UPI0005DBBB63|nr:MMPL family transporter [Paeniclostridium sordellii]MBX9180307.1 MMPL family transporter [Paeniclostridium sordellii]CEO10307.1 antibiotic ABC transporter permease [[Clostridium] sordellii] [Paeniclostridium sordellii]CEO25975.1 antibiotic ABC transporter permease [[Clostridium] sordellii] [Paeniclostridium sordellii]CEP44183.1 antibiotic ABC transporter permease [[Clostridium] sordellii] [Paeniclostridium sordellii]CEP84372.1 antibiotic ABC transporter permease [[Clostridium] sordellii] [P
MRGLSKLIAKKSKLILVIAILLLIPSAIGFLKTDINYDILSYLPDNLSTTQAEKILKEDFNCGSLAMLIVENMEDKDVSKLKEKVSKVDGVVDVLWIDDFLDLSVPKEMLPKDINDLLYTDNSTLMVIKLEEGSASLKTLNAVESIRNITGNQAFLSGMASIIKDTKDISDKETPLYVVIAVILTLIVLSFTMDSYVTPFIFLLSIGFAIIYNFGSNIIFGEISYITKALSAVLQLGVTMDYSIFLLHRYDEERDKYDSHIDAMAIAIQNTTTSIFGSSLTTIAGFLALCAMDLALGMDMGLVMAKGVLLGVICTVTVLPALILIFDKQIHKYKHRPILPTFKKSSEIVVKHYKKLVVLFLLLFIPSIIGSTNAKVYYNLDESLPDNLPSIIATNKLKKDYNMNSTNIVLVKDSLKPYKVEQMIKEIENLDGINSVVALEKIIGPSVVQDILPSNLLNSVKSGGYEQLVVNSKYRAATDEAGIQIKKLNEIVHKYDKNGLVGGEAPLTDDLIKIADTDFKTVSLVSIIAIFVIIAVVFKSISLPVILVLAIESAIFINLGIPYYTNTIEPFIASIVIGTIQLGATVDYAILLTSRYKEELSVNENKFEAMRISIQSSARSIVTSALSFFSATIGVGLISKLEMISALCSLMARGAIISMFIIIFMLPAILLTFNSLIIKTSKNFIPKKSSNLNKGEI